MKKLTFGKGNENIRKSDEKGGTPVSIFWSHFGQKSIKTPFKKSLKNQSPINMEMYAKRSQNGAKI